MEQDNTSNHSVHSENSEESDRAKLAHEHVERMRKLEIEHIEEMNRLKKDIKEDKIKFNAWFKEYDAELQAFRDEFLNNIRRVRREFEKTDIKFDYGKPKPKSPTILTYLKPAVIPAAAVLLLSVFPNESREKVIEKWNFIGRGHDVHSESIFESSLEKKLEDYNPEEHTYSYDEAIFMYENFNERDKIWARIKANKLKDENIFNEEDAKLFVRAVPYLALIKFYTKLYGDDTKRNFRIACTESAFHWRNENEFPPRIEKGGLGEEGPYHIMPSTEKEIAESDAKKDVFYNLSKHSEEKNIIASIYYILYCKEMSIKDGMSRDIDIYHKFASGPKNTIRIKYLENYRRVAHLNNFLNAEQYLKLLPYLEDFINVCLNDKNYEKEAKNINDGYQRLVKK